MDVFPRSLTGAALSARDRLASLAAQTAAAPGAETRRMTAAAATAVFADALLGALRARLEEVRTALK